MSIANKLKSYDKVTYGVTVSVLLLILGFFLSYLIIYAGAPTDFSVFLQYFKVSGNRMDILILCMIPNMVLFYLTNFQWKMYNFIKGLVTVCVLFCLVIVFLSL